MSSKLGLFLTLATLTFSSIASATIIDFDDYKNNSSGNGELIGTEYSDLGVEFSTTGLALNIGATVGSGPNSLGADASSTNDFDGDIIIQFLNNSYVTDLAFTIFNTPFSASAFDVNGKLLSTLSGGSFTSTFDFSGFDVSRVEISGAFYAIDDVSFGKLISASVPEPSTLALLALGIVGIGSLRKKISADANTKQAQG